MTYCSGVVTFFLLTIVAVLAVDWNIPALWDKRTLRCKGDVCTLEIKKIEDIAKCHTEEIEGESRFVCGINCPGADRDSVISKIPMWNHKCVRFSNYDTLNRGDDWFIYRSGNCRTQNITLEVHCGFPQIHKTTSKNDTEIV